MRNSAVDMVSKLVEEHGLHEAYQIALKGAAEALKLEDNYSLSVMREIKACLRSKIDEQIKLAECNSS